MLVEASLDRDFKAQVLGLWICIPFTSGLLVVSYSCLLAVSCWSPGRLLLVVVVAVVIPVAAGPRMDLGVPGRARRGIYTGMEFRGT